jgi:hypothetical protein
MLLEVAMLKIHACPFGILSRAVDSTSKESKLR